MNTALQQVVNAVLYEGYILYPYRASSVKNQRERFTFGRVYPRAYSELQNGAEACSLQMECLLKTSGQPAQLKVTLGFLQPVTRQIGVFDEPLLPPQAGNDPKYNLVPQIDIDGRLFQAWTEAAEQQIPLEVNAWPGAFAVPFALPASQGEKPVYNQDGKLAALVLRQRCSLQGKIDVATTELVPGLFRLSVRVTNLSKMPSDDLKSSEQVLLRTFASTHVILEAARAEFVSLLNPPPEFARFAADCKNIGCWPVLVGDEKAGERNAMLASPIILYDYPRIAPESSGDFFDGTEIDEILTLRVQTLTDAEKREMRADDFARRILERTDSLQQDAFLKLHGKTQATPAAEEFFNPARRRDRVSINGIELQAGDQVCIRPKRRADAFDWVLAGKTAVIEAIEEDVEGHLHFALVLPEDPGCDLGLARQSGHRFFFGVDEVEPLKARLPV